MFEVGSILDFVQSGFCPIRDIVQLEILFMRDFVYSELCRIRDFVQIGILSNSGCCPF